MLIYSDYIAQDQRFNYLFLSNNFSFVVIIIIIFYLLMSIKSSHYETVLADYCNRESIISLLRNHREYMEMIPSMRRPIDSVISIPLPLAKVHNLRSLSEEAFNQIVSHEMISIPCDIAILMCDPQWKIKMGVEILVFIHRPQEDFSNLLRRWRKSQIYLSQEYEWIMPNSEEHMFSDVAEQILPLFVIFPESPERIKKGLQGASLPYMEYTMESVSEDHKSHSLSNG